VFSAQTEPGVDASFNDRRIPLSVPEETRPLEESRPPNVPRRIIPATQAGADEPDWAKEPPADSSIQTQAGIANQTRADFTRPATAEPVRPSGREVRLVSNQEPPDATANTETPESSSTVSSPVESSPAVTTSTDSSLAGELKLIDEQIANEEYLVAHRALSKIYWNHREERDQLLRRLNKTSRAIFFEPRPHLVEPYVVQPNDQLRVIAGKYNLSWEYLAKLNRTDPKRIQLGQKLKVLKGPFSAVVDLREFALTVHLQGYYVKRYEVGIGKDGSSPIGRFTVLGKLENPQYTDPNGKVISGDDPANPLGERWIDLGDSYGIHGTIEPDSIGKAASRGCIRMREKDVIEVYDFLVKGSEVVIRK
jgi:LysM repeat protein